jgi:hypothetical protein
MDVFLLPIAGNRYVLYCEAAPVDPADAETGRRTLWSRAVNVFRRVLAEGEAERHRSPSDPVPERSRIRRWLATRLADAVAEQRLLWYLRKESDAALVHPDDMNDDRAVELTRAQLGHDMVHHMRWCIIDSLIAIACIPVALLPGPNVLGYYFLFRAVGHLYSLRGARHALKDMAWRCRPTPHLTALRRALTHARAQREQEIEAVARALGLDRLAAFINRAAPVPGA